MRQQPEKQPLTSMQKQAVLVCIVCALAALLTVGITLTLIQRGKGTGLPTEQPGSEDTSGAEDISGHYQINETSSALLTETADAGENYQNETLFIGDSNTVRLYANGLISLQQFCAKEGIGTHAALNDGIVTFKRDTNRYTIAQAVAKMKPRRVVIMLGTNDTGMEATDFIANYTALIQAIQASYPYTDIIVNTVPPVPANHANYPQMDQTKIDDFNMALLSMCEQMGLKFLNTAEALKDSTGYGNADYYLTNDIHLKPAGLKVLLNYLRTHVYQTEDRRPDTANIPTRAEYTSTPSSAVAAPSSSEAVSSSAAEEQPADTAPAVEYQASYRVDKTGGGSLSAGSESGKSALAYNITSAAQSVSVTAVPDAGYVFVKWSDGVTQKTRTDTDFKQNLDVTAVFAAASVHVAGDGRAVVGGQYTFRVKLSGKYLDASSIRWYANGAEVTAAAGQTTVTVPITAEMQGTAFKVYAVASYNDCRVSSNTLEVTVAGAPASSTSPASSGSTSGASSGTTSASSEETSSSNGTAASSSHSTASSSGSAASSSHSTASGSGSAASSSHSTASGSGSAANSSHSTSGSSAESASGTSHSTSSAEGSSHSSGSVSSSHSSSGTAGEAAASSTSHSSSAAASSSHASSAASAEQGASREAASSAS